jgi:hypothetical protein
MPGNSVRPFVRRLAIVTCVTPAALIAVVAASALAEIEPQPVLTIALLAAWLALRVAPANLRVRLSSDSARPSRSLG